MCAQHNKAFESLSTHERRLVTETVLQLRRVPARGAPTAVFDALRACAPIAGGLIGAMREGGVDAVVSHAVRLPEDVLEGWAGAPREQLSFMLGPLFSARPGQLISDTQAIRGSYRKEVELLHLLRACGLGEAAGYKVNDEAVGGSRGLVFMTFALEAGRNFTPRDHAMLAALRTDIQASLERLRLPLVPSQSILAQVVEERRLGFVCITRDGRCIELNQRAREIIADYQRSARIESGRSIASSFALRAIAQTQGGRLWKVQHESGERYLETSAHTLAKETHMLGDDLWLVMMQETSSPRRDQDPFAGLTERQREIARLLVETGLNYKEIADRLSIAEGTVRTHIEHIYRRMKVRSRGELVERSR